MGVSVIYNTGHFYGVEMLGIGSPFPMITRGYVCTHEGSNFELIRTRGSAFLARGYHFLRLFHLLSVNEAFKLICLIGTRLRYFWQRSDKPRPGSRPSQPRCQGRRVCSVPRNVVLHSAIRANDAETLKSRFPTSQKSSRESSIRKHDCFPRENPIFSDR